MSSSMGLTAPRPIPRFTMASFRAYSRCRLTSLAAFFLLNRICTIASSIGLPAICLASGPNFFTLVLIIGDLQRDIRSVRAICVVLDILCLPRISRITIFRCHRFRAWGLGSRAAAMLARFRRGCEGAPEVDGCCVSTLGAEGSSNIEDGAKLPGRGAFSISGLRFRKSRERGSRNFESFLRPKRRPMKVRWWVNDG